MTGWDPNKKWGAPPLWDRPREFSGISEWRKRHLTLHPRQADYNLNTSMINSKIKGHMCTTSLRMFIMIKPATVLYLLYMLGCVSVMAVASHKDDREWKAVQRMVDEHRNNDPR